MEGENNANLKANISEAEASILENKNTAISSDDETINIRKEKVMNFLKEKYSLISYVVLAVIVFLALRIRTRNLGGLRDITTNDWTLGPDLDPFLFLRHAKEIIENGSLAAVDYMRYVPIGFEAKRGFILHEYLIAWFHKIAVLFGSESVTQSAAIFPAFMFGLTVIAFFLMTRKIFSEKLGEKKANVIALIASFLLSVAPALLPRTIAGIPEKESAAFLFMFLAFYFFLSSWSEKNKIKSYGLSVLAGLSTGAMALIWGGYAFIFITLIPAVFFSFLLGKTDDRNIYSYGLWILSAFVPMYIFSIRYSITRLLSSETTGSAVVVLFIMIAHNVIFRTNLKKHFQTGRVSKIPPRAVSAIASVVILIVLASLIFGASFVPNNINNVVNNLVKPATSRLIQTVAENRQPYFTEWASNFGPNYRNLPLTFWLFFIGSIYLFHRMIKTLKKNEKIWLTVSYIIFLTATIFSRYSGGSRLNGENSLSLAFYGLGALFFVFVFGFYYYKRYKNNELDELKNIDFGFMFLLSFFFLGIISARAAVRTIMVLAIPTSIVISYFAFSVFDRAMNMKEGGKKTFAWIIALIVIVPTVYSGYVYYNVVNETASQFVPSIYTQQWQKAMAWVRENAPENAVFGHWWDYGYWVQSIGERATVLDGGNGISYWNHLMGRYALTGTSNREALEFLYAHNTTHFLIDSTDIGKYSAYSLIGGDENYDRASYIPTLVKDVNQMQERKNSTVFVYPANSGLDDDVVFEDNGTKVFLPKGAAGLGAVLIEKNNDGSVNQPLGIFVYQGQQYTLPFRYMFYNEFIDFGSGVESGVYLFPRAIQSGNSLQIDFEGAMLYLSERVVKSQLARLYLYKENNPNFKLVLSEDDFIVGQIKAGNPGFSNDIIYFQGFRGPIRIWEINYPKDIEFKEEFIDTVYPERLRLA